MILLRLFLITFFISFPVFVSAETILLRDATYYSPSFEGAYTSNGEVFSQNTDSAAICDTPLGQWLYVRSVSTWVLLRANDRPNCARYPELIDLSSSVFQTFAPLSQGKVNGLEVTPVVFLTNEQKSWIMPNAFEDLGILLDNRLPTLAFAGEGMEITGKVINGEKQVLIYLKNIDTGVITDTLMKLSIANGRFRIPFLLPKVAWKYMVIIVAGNSFHTDQYSLMNLIGPTHIHYPALPTASWAIWLPKVDSYNGQSSISLPEKTWAELILKQDGREYKTSGTALFMNPSGFSPGTAFATIQGFWLSTPSVFDRSSVKPNLFSGSIILDRMHEKIGADRATFSMGKKSVTLRMRTPRDIKIRDTYYPTTPDGKTHEYPLPSRFTSEDGFLKTNIRINITTPLTEIGTYKIEMVQADGLAYINMPVSFGNVWWVLSPDLMRKKKGISIQNTLSNRINILRAWVSEDLLILDVDLTQLAQAKVDDMMARNYVGHVSPDGQDIVAFAQKKWFNFIGAIGENIVSWNVSEALLQDGLEESGSHRMNMLRSEWKKIGIGYGVKNGETYIVQIFGGIIFVTHFILYRLSYGDLLFSSFL